MCSPFLQSITISALYCLMGGMLIFFRIDVYFYLNRPKSGVSMSKSFVIFQSSVMFIKCNIGMQTQNVIYFNSISGMVQVSSCF